MMLKSDGFASNIYEPESAFTLRQFCADKGIEYADARDASVDRWERLMQA
jgi:hypothetical protein